MSVRTISAPLLFFYAAEVQQQFYSREKDWMRGLNLPPSFNNTQCATGTEPGEYYLTGIGNQCGCGNGRFHPTYSSWIANDATLISNSKSEQLQEHSILRLVKRLIKSNYTLCFAGDSIDLQLYESVFRQLQRLEGLQQKYFNASLSFNSCEVQSTVRVIACWISTLWIWIQINETTEGNNS